LKCNAPLVATDRRKNAHVRHTLRYDDDSALVRDATALLRRLAVVRMKQDSCPGSGHFASGRAALDGVIRLGFSGQIEVVHSVDADSMRNMRLCYRDFDAGGYDAEGPRGNRARVDYVALPNTEHLGFFQGLGVIQQFFNQRGLQTLGIYGAADGYGDEHEEEEEENGLEEQDGLHGLDRLDALPTGGPAQTMNTRCSVVLQPFAWPRIRLVEDRNSTGGLWREQILADTLASHIIDVPDMVAALPPYQRHSERLRRTVEAYATANQGNTADGVLRTLVAVLAKVLSGGCHLLPVYGLHTNTGELAMNTVVRAVKVLRDREFIDGPVIIYNILGRHDADAESVLVCGRAQLLASDGATPTAITNAVDGIYVVRSEGLSNPLFQQLAANATLPMLLEGANTANLCLQLGTPFLALSDNDSIPVLEGRGAGGRAALQGIAPTLWGAQRASDDQIARVADAIRDALTADTVLHTYFDRLHQIVRAPESDQLAFALATLQRRIQAAGPPLPVVPVQPLPPAAVQAPLPPPATVYKCANCKNFASLSPGSCWKCSRRLELAVD
jgi:hypothetical protein